MKLAGGSQYATSLLWVSFFGSSQPCAWLTGQIEAQQNFNHKLLPQFLGESHQTLQALWPPETMWFLFTFVNAYQGFQVAFFANRHLTHTE